jgi:hypothetical protein
MAFRHTGVVHPQTALHPGALRQPGVPVWVGLAAAALAIAWGAAGCAKKGRPEETIHCAVPALACAGEGDQHGARCDAGKDEQAACASSVG